ncbi:hypothetical protein HHL23_12550 [Chryseobacterium sp. RP-3-3]|uniref:DUF7825 domain-containing protein n=1 Tax=Chryseobacterium antibioticum TaxID=2728847 RepID=A0A7Y0ANN2_9FLAO|nr:DUF6493 family protein [Chryseobacterium antibioticum]NML70630.1 hypothetical protein [Chryseobacterium antibioticum]
MLIGDELKTIYLNYRIKEIVPFLIKLTPKEKKETAVILKKYLNKDWGYNHVSMLATLACSSTQDEYEKWAPGYYAAPIHLIDELFESYVPEWIGNSYPFLRNIDYLKVLEWQQKGYLKLNDEVCANLLSESLASDYTSEELRITIENKEISAEAPLLDHLFNSYHGVYDQYLIRILYTAPYFSGSVFAKKYNETLSNAVYQYDSRTNTEFLDAWMKLDLPFQPVHYLFLSAAMFSKDKTFSGTAFEAIIHKIVSDDFDIETLGIMIGENINFGLVPVKRLTDGISGFIGLNSSHNRAFEKLLISILTAINHPVFNLKKILEIYYELLHLNQSPTDDAVIGKLKEWENENNLKKMIIKLKTNERKIV